MIFNKWRCHTHIHTSSFVYEYCLHVDHITMAEKKCRLSYYESQKFDKALKYQIENFCGDSDSDSDSDDVEKVVVGPGRKSRASVAGLDDVAGPSREPAVGTEDVGASIVGDDEDNCESESAGGDPIEKDEREKFLTALRNYSVKFNVTIVQITHLLVLLAPFLNFPIPKSGKTVMRVPVKTPKPIVVAPGHYIHIGLEMALAHVPVSVAKLAKLILDFNLDGVKMTESPVSCSWPIMCHIVGSNLKPFPVGVYLGPQQPASANEYLRMFVEELLRINGRKVLVSSLKKEMEVELRLFSTDTKARTFITCK